MRLMTILLTRLAYLEIVLERWSEIASARRRTGTLIVSLGVGSVSLAGAKHGEFTLGPLKLTNVSSVLTIVPATISFLLYELAALMAAAQRYRHVVKALVGRLYPPVAANDLGRLLAPAAPALWGHDQWSVIREFARNRSTTVLGGLNAGLGVALVLGPFVFLAYAFAEL